jgi:nicotinate dehydrogenase subunit B
VSGIGLMGASDVSVNAYKEALYGIALRPPTMRWEGQQCLSSTLLSLNVDAAAQSPGVVQVVQLAEFRGVVAVSAVQARQAIERLQARWQFQRSSHLAQGSDSVDVEPDDSAYVWLASASSEAIGVFVTVWCTDSHVTVWTTGATVSHRIVKNELSALLDIPHARMTVVDSVNASTSAVLDVLDAIADAALLSRAVGRPVRVDVRGTTTSTALTLRRRGQHDESLAETADVVDTDHAVCPQGGPATAQAPSWVSNQPWALRPSLARLLSQPLHATAVTFPRVVMDADLSSTACRPDGGLSQASVDEIEAMQVFAQESLVDEQAARLGVDPIEHRLALLPQGPGRALVQHVAQQSSWATLARPADVQASTQTLSTVRTGVFGDDTAPNVLRGRGYAVAQVRDDETKDSTVETWSAWVVEVEVNPNSGHVDVTRVVVGHDSQSLQSATPASIHDQNPALLDAARRLLSEPASFDDWGATSTSQHSLHQPLVAIDESIHAANDSLVKRGQLAVDGVMTLPAAAAIGNAIYDATGVRLRQVPFDTAYLKDQLTSSISTKEAGSRRWWRRSGLWLATGVGAVAGMLSMAWPLKSEIAPTAGPDTSLYSDAAIERGRLVAIAGDCMVCHTAPNGEVNAGGLGLDTPFGRIYTTNITPDNETGIGQWSYRAFERAMREGVHRDGRQLYPAFPYTSFAKLTDADMQALYAYLMVQPPVRSEAPKTELAFPYNLRPLVAGWNAMFHDTGVFEPDPTQSTMWNRGAYLVQGAGHCAACHSPRNTLGAEKRSIGDYLAGGEAEGWDAPALNRLATGKVPWTEDSLFQYLRTGYSANNGVAAGPMAPVVQGLAELPESDVRAMAHYLLNLPGSDTPKLVAQAAAVVAPSSTEPEAARRVFAGQANGERIYQNACAVCHEANAGPTLFGVKPLLDVNTNLHADKPDNLVQVIMHGIQTPSNDDLGYMPGFKDSLDNEQVQDLISYLRARFAPREPDWGDSRNVIDRVRSQSH